MDDDYTLETMEIDLDVAECGEVLERHSVTPSVELVMALWEWKHEKNNLEVQQ